jgi:putative zinc finger protein
MCDFAGKLIAWLDHELPAEEAAEVERHLAGCSECRSDVDAYKRVSGEFDAYCDAAIASSARRGAPRWAPVVLGAGAVAALVALFLAMPRTRVDPPAFHRPQTVVAASPVIAAKVSPASVSLAQRVDRRRAVTPVSVRDANAAPPQSQDANVLPDEPMIQIAIPADEMFPPGAVPEGIHFVADVTIAADGSAERLRLRPRLAGFERRTTQP